MSTRLYFRPIEKSYDHPTFEYMLLAKGSTSTNRVTTASAGAQEIQVTKTAGGENAEWISARVSTAFALVSTITFNIWALEGNGNLNTGVASRVFVLSANGSTETQVASANFGSPPNELFTTTSVCNWTTTPTSTNVAVDERLIVRFYVIPAGGTMGGANNVVIAINGPTVAATGDSYIDFFEDIAWKTETITHTLKTAGGDYTAMSSWEAAQQDDLVIADVIKQLECYSGSFFETGGAAIAGWTTGPNNYIRVYTPTTERHAARASTGCTCTASATTLGIQEEYVRVEGLCLVCLSSSGIPLNINNGIGAANAFMFDSNIFVHRTAQTAAVSLNQDADARITFTNNIVIGRGSAGVCAAQGTRELYFANNTIFGVNGAERGLVLGQSASTVHQFYNNVIVGCTSAIAVITSTGTARHNAGDQNSINALSSSLTVAAASCFVNTTAGKEDFRHLATSPLLAAGTSYSVVTADIMNYPRAATPSIGAHERYRGTVDLIGTSTVGGWRPDFPTMDAWVGWLSTQSTLAQTVTGAFLNELFTPSGTLEFFGITTATDKRLILRAATSTETGGAPAKHNGLAGTGARITKTNGASWGIIYTTTSTIKHWEVHDLELFAADTGNPAIYLNNGAGNIIDFMGSGLLVHNLDSSGIIGAWGAGGTIRVWNSFFWDVSDTCVIGDSGNFDLVECDNVTAVKAASDVAVGKTGLRYCIVKNCAVFHYGPNSSHADFLNTGTGSSNNVSSDGSAPGASSITSAIASACFESVGGTWDLHLKSGSPLIGQGVFLANVSVDIDGQSRGSTVDIGADEFFQTDSAVNQSVALLWNIQERVNSTLSVLWNIQERINKSYDTTWNINERIAKSYDVTYNIHERIAKTYEALYDIHERVKKDYNALWDIYERVGVEKLVVWNLQERVASQINALWDIHERVNKSIDAVWNIEKLVAKDVSFTWNLEERVAKELQAIWNMEGGQPPVSLRHSSRQTIRRRSGQTLRLRGRH